MIATAVSIAAMFPLAYITAAVSADRARMLERLDIFRIRAGFGKPVLAITATPYQHEPAEPEPAVAPTTVPLPSTEVSEQPRPRGYRGAHRAGDTAEFHAIVARSFPLRSASYVESAT